MFACGFIKGAWAYGYLLTNYISQLTNKCACKGIYQTAAADQQTMVYMVGAYKLTATYDFVFILNMIYVC